MDERRYWTLVEQASLYIDPDDILVPLDILAIADSEGFDLQAFCDDVFCLAEGLDAAAEAQGSLF